MPSKGFTLIEIMVAMVIGLVVIGGATAMFYSIHRSYVLQLAISRVEDEGQFAVQYMGDIIRMAGYRHMMAPDPQGLAFDGGTLILRLDTTFGCDGQKLAQYEAYEYQFSLGDDQSLQRTCSSSGGNITTQGTTTTQPIAGSSNSRYGAQIEDLQFRVGIDQDGDGSVDRYDQSTTVNWEKPEESLQVRSVQLCLEVASSDPVFHDQNISKPYLPCSAWSTGSTSESVPDYCQDRYCQIFLSTIYLRNRGMP